MSTHMVLCENIFALPGLALPFSYNHLLFRPTLLVLPLEGLGEAPASNKLLSEVFLEAPPTALWNKGLAFGENGEFRLGVPEPSLADDAGEVDPPIGDAEREKRGGVMYVEPGVGGVSF